MAASRLVPLELFKTWSPLLQALAYASLGGYYQRQPKGAGAARKCFQRALAIDPCLAAAGSARTLCTHHLCPSQPACWQALDWCRYCMSLRAACCGHVQAMAS